MRDETTNFWVNGWTTACKRLKSELNDAAQKVNDSEAQRTLDETFKIIDRMEKQAFSEAPTVISHNVSCDKRESVKISQCPSEPFGDNDPNSD
jgi:hypothetical protein